MRHRLFRRPARGARRLQRAVLIQEIGGHLDDPDLVAALVALVREDPVLASIPHEIVDRPVEVRDLAFLRLGVPFSRGSRS